MLFSFCLTAVLGLMVTTAAAVDLRNYPQGFCTGSRAECRNINSNTCCRRGSDSSSTFRSGSCRADVKTHRHIIYRPSGSNACGSSWLGNNCSDDTNCIADTEGRLTGHQWRQGSTRQAVDAAGADLCDAGQDPEEAGCTGVVEPDVLVFAGRAFELNGTVITEEQKNQLWAHFTEYSSMEANGITLSAMFDIPAEFEDFEIPYYD